MKNIFKILGIFVGASIALASCQKKLDLKNPNAPTQVSIETPRAGISNWQTGEMARYASLLCQQIAMGSDPNLSFNQLYNNYVITNSDYKYPYENAYSLILNPASILKTEEADLISALTYVNLEQTFTNAFKLSPEGEVPLTESDIMNLLDPIISGGGEFSAAANMVKAKYYLNHEKYADALPLVQNFQPENSYQYASSGTFNNSTNWDQYRKNRQNYMQSDSFGQSFFTGADSLRYRLYFGHGPTDDYNTPIQVNANNVLGFANALITVDIIGFTEAKLIEAECLARTGGNPDAALNEAIKANYTSIGLDPTTAPSISGATLDDTKTIIYQTLWGHPQILFNMRRWQSEGYLPGFTEKVPGQFPGKHTYIVQ